MEIIDFQFCRWIHLVRYKLIMMERRATGRKKQKKRQKQADGLMFQEGKDLHKRWNDEEGGGGGQHDAQRQDEACAEHDRMFGSEQSARRKNRGKSG